jgi:hypothetical protein
VNTLQVEVFNLVHLSHSASCDEANDEKPAPEDLARPGAALRGDRRSNPIRVAAFGLRTVAKILTNIYGCFVEKTGGRIMGRTCSARIFDEQRFDRTPELEISAADFFEEGMGSPGLIARAASKNCSTNSC